MPDPCIVYHPKERTWCVTKNKETLLTTFNPHEALKYKLKLEDEQPVFAMTWCWLRLSKNNGNYSGSIFVKDICLGAWNDQGERITFNENVRRFLSKSKVLSYEQY